MGNIKEDIDRKPSQDKNDHLPINGITILIGGSFTHVNYPLGWTLKELNIALSTLQYHVTRGGGSIDLDDNNLPRKLRDERIFRRQGLEPPTESEEDIKPKVRKKREARFVPSNIYDSEIDQDPEIFPYKSATYNPRTRKLSLPTASDIQLTPMQGWLTRSFIKNGGEVLLNSLLVHEVWKRDDVGDNRLRILVRGVRIQIGDKKRNWNNYSYINSVKTENGLWGYRFDIPETQDLPNL